MNDPKMTARERLRPHSIRHEEDELGVVSRVVLLDVAIQIAEEHAAAAVAELERERDSAVALANALLLDIGKIAEALGSEASEPSALLADAQALKARVAELEAERDEARFQAEYYADGLESLADDLPEWQHQHADGETEDQSIIERAITTVVEWRSEKAKREKAEARIVELEAERDEARERAICAASSEARRIDERDIAYAALTSAAKALAANDFDLAREVLCRSSARDKAAELRRADMKHTLAAAARAEKAEARVAELEGILHDAPTIDAVESHVPGWLARVRAALGKEAQT